MHVLFLLMTLTAIATTTLSVTTRPFIFFLDSSGDRNEPYFITLCAVESAAVQNPGHEVHVYSNAFDTQTWSHVSSHIKVLPFEPLIWMGSDASARDFDAMRQWYLSDASAEGFAINNIADAMRLVLLYKHGGTYLDTDVLSLKPLSSLGQQENILAYQNEEKDLKLSQEAELTINVATMVNFFPHAKLLKDMIATFVKEFQADRWGWQGPQLVTRVYKKGAYSNVTLLQKHTLNPVGWHQVKSLFETAKDGDGALLWQHILSKSTLVHLWGSLISKQLPYTRDDSVIAQLYRETCPVFYASHFEKRPPASSLFPSALIRGSREKTRPDVITHTAAHLHGSILLHTRIKVSHPRVGQQLSLRDWKDFPRVTYAITLELDVEGAVAEMGYVNYRPLNRTMENEMRRILAEDVMVCTGVLNEMRTCRPLSGDSINAKDTFGHVLSPGYHVIFTWLETRQRGIRRMVSPMSMMAITSISVNFKDIKITSQEKVRRRQLQDFKDSLPMAAVLKGPTKFGTMSYYSNDVHFARQLAVGRMYDEATLDTLAPYIIASSVILDVGGHCGSHSVAYASINPLAKIFTYEPQKKMFRLLQQNIADNNLEGQVVALNYALGNKACAATMGLNTFGADEVFNPFGIKMDGETFLPTEALANFGGMSIGKGGEPIDIKRLDSLKIVSEHKIDFIKVDIEGFEDVFCDGAKRIIERDLPVIFYENNEKSIIQDMEGVFEEVHETITEVLERLNYTITLISNSNYLAVPPRL
jgi:FkbM family methyltransferase